MRVSCREGYFRICGAPVKIIKCDHCGARIGVDPGHEDWMPAACSDCKYDKREESDKRPVKSQLIEIGDVKYMKEY